MNILPEEADLIIGMSAFWVFAGLMLAGWGCMHAVQNSRLRERYGSEPEIVDQAEHIAKHEAAAYESALAHEAWQIENWKRIPELDRLRCMARLWKFIPHEKIDKWVKDKAEGFPIASDDVWFHHGYGMAIRNELRAVLPDERLPAIRYPGGNLYHNWDDFYRGALNEMIEQAVTAYNVARAA